MSATAIEPFTSSLESLRTQGVEVDTSSRCRSEYSYDASNYRVQPLGVVFPRTVHDVVAALRWCKEFKVPLTSRGGGTSMAGNAVGPGLVLDFSRHMSAILAVNTEQRTTTVEPGLVLSVLQQHIERFTDGELTFAPDPSSKSRATIGGAVGNDACGNHSVRYGRTSDHVVALDLVTASGHRLTATATGLCATGEHDDGARREAARLSDDLRRLSQDHMADFRLQLGRIPRQVSGFHLLHLLPENGFNVARALVGSEGTCAVVVAATMRLVPKPPSALLVSLGYNDVVDAARDIMTILEYSPAAIEGIDEAIVETMRFRRGPEAVQGLPAGRAWLYVDLDGESREVVETTAAELLERLRGNGRLIAGRVVPDPGERASLWRVREDGAGLASRLSTDNQSVTESWPGWEDSAVAPENLADYLAEFQKLLAEYKLHGVMYGHFGAGCMHIRITYDLRSDKGRTVMDQFNRAAAELVVRHGGSLSGEHGDGRARSQLLPIMYPPAILSAFARFKASWDPHGLLNPGSITAAQGITENLALAGVPEREWRTSFDLSPVATGAAGMDPFAHAVQGCVGIGRCRSDSGGVMCPSYRATGNEKDSTRGRARVLQDMIRGARTVEEGWKSEDVRGALDLCLSCKACSTDCPVGVDMATYKSEFFDHYYRRRLRPMSHYSLGWLPWWLKIAGRIAPLVNLMLRGPSGKLAARLGGLSTERALPSFAAANAWRKATSTRTGRTPSATAHAVRLVHALRAALPGGIPRDLHETSGADRTTALTGDTGVVLFVDTFTRGFRPQVAGAAKRVLEGAGQRVQCSADACCGLTWISTGQLGTAKKMLARAAETLDDGTDRPIVVIEPSCAAAFRKDLPELVHTDAARRVAARIQSFASAVTDLSQEGWTPQWQSGSAPEAVTVQTHCHEYSTFGAAVQRSALAAVGISTVNEATGCCGVAGNFGFEAAHYDVSMAVAQQALAPALSATAVGIPVLTDGFSCQMQVNQLDPGRPSLHLAELLDPGTPSTKNQREQP